MKNVNVIEIRSPCDRVVFHSSIVHSNYLFLNLPTTISSVNFSKKKVFLQYLITKSNQLSFSIQFQKKTAVGIEHVCRLLNFNAFEICIEARKAPTQHNHFIDLKVKTSRNFAVPACQTFRLDSQSLTNKRLQFQSNTFLFFSILLDNSPIDSLFMCYSLFASPNLSTYCYVLKYTLYTIAMSDSIFHLQHSQCLLCSMDTIFFILKIFKTKFFLQ